MNQKTFVSRRWKYTGPAIIALVYLGLSLFWLLFLSRRFGHLSRHESMQQLNILHIGYYVIVSLCIYGLSYRTLGLSRTNNAQAQLLENLHEPLLIHQDLRIVDANEHAVDFLEADSRDTLIGSSILDFIHPEFLELAKRRIAGLYKGKPTPVMEQLWLTRRGAHKYVEVIGVPTEFQGKRATIVTIRDITKRKHAETQLRGLLERFQLIEENNDNAVAILTASGEVQYLSPSYSELVGCNPMTEYGRLSAAFIHPDDRDWIVETMRNAAMFGLREQAEYRIQHQSGKWLHVESTCQPIDADDDGVRRALLVTRNISERVESEEMIRQSEKLAAVGQLAAGIVHEVRNPLTAIKGFVQMLADGDELRAQYYRIILDEITRMELMTQELLLLAKPKSTELRLCLAQQIISDAAALLDAQALLQNVNFKVHMDTEPVWIHCDANQMKQVVINIVKNAIEACADGGRVDLSVRTVGGSVKIVSMDNGSGIPTEQLEQIGQPFFTTKSDGNGLGLMISKRIVEQHHGVLQFDSSVNKGTIVTLELPLAAAPIVG